MSRSMTATASSSPLRRKRVSPASLGQSLPAKGDKQTQLARHAWPLQKVFGTATAFVFSSLAPALLMTAISSVASTPRFATMVFAFTLFVALGHAVLLGLPMFLIFQFRRWRGTWQRALLLGFAIGALPVGILTFSVSIWVSYVKPLMYFGLLGAFGGLVFWAVLKCWAIFDGGRQTLPNNSLKAQASTATPLCIASKLAAPRLTGVLSAAVPDHSRRTGPVAYQGEHIRRYIRVPQGVASNE
jgi:hypothetical protein